MGSPPFEEHDFLFRSFVMACSHKLEIWFEFLARFAEDNAAETEFAGELSLF